MECFLLTDTLGVQNRESTDNGKIATKECFLVAQTIKTLPAMQKIQVRSLGREDPLVEGMATHTSILTWYKLLRKATRIILSNVSSVQFSR